MMEVRMGYFTKSTRNRQEMGKWCSSLEIELRTQREQGTVVYLMQCNLIFTFAYFEHMLSQKLNQRKPQEEGVEHQNQFDACFLQLLLLWPINHGQPLPAQRVVVTWPKSNSYQSFGGSDYWCVLLLWTTWWRVVRELENVSRGKTFYPTSPIYLSSVCPTWHAKKSENTFLLLR